MTAQGATVAQKTVLHFHGHSNGQGLRLALTINYVFISSAHYNDVLVEDNTH